MKKTIKYLLVLLALLFTFTFKVSAASVDIYVNLTTLEYSTNNKDYTSLKEYKTLEEFLVDYKGTLINKVAAIYGANGSGKTSFLDSLHFLKLNYYS